MKRLQQLLMTCTVLGLGSFAMAGNGFEIDADIEKLEARIRPAGTQWDIDAVFEVEVESDFRPQDLVLVLQLQNGGQMLYTQDNRPFELVIPLDQPSEVDDDELEFRGNLSFSVPTNQVTHYKSLRLVGYVFTDPQSPALDRDDTRIKLADGIDDVLTSYSAPQTQVFQPQVAPQQPVLEQQYDASLDAQYIEQLPSQPVPVQQPVIVQPQTQVFQPAPVVVQQPFVQPIVNVNPRPAINVGFGLGFGRNYGFRNWCPTPYRRTTVIRRGGFGGFGRPVIGRPVPLGFNRSIIGRRGLGGSRVIRIRR